MTHAALAALAILYWIILGTTHSWAPTALMLAAIARDAARQRAGGTPLEAP